METLRALVSAQWWVTAFLAVLLWSLHARFHRVEFNKWWAAAWTSSALFLAAGWFALGLPPERVILRGTFVLLAMCFGFIVAPLLVFGAMSLRSPASITRRTAWLGIGGALALGAVVFVASFAWTDGVLAGLSVRHVARTVVLAAALLYCARVFYERVRNTGSVAALVTCVSCLGHAITQPVYATAMSLYVIDATSGAANGPGFAALPAAARLLYFDVAFVCGICVGMILLLMEAYQQSESELVESASRRREVTEENKLLQQEIKRREEVERRLLASEDRYRDLVEHSADLICTHDLDGRILSCNQSSARLLGYDVSEILTMSMRDIVAPEVRPAFDQYLTDILHDGRASGVVKVITRDGERRLWAFNNSLRIDGVESPIIRGMAHDITEQHRAERALRASEEKFAIAFRSSPSAKAIISCATGRFLDVNAAFESLSGFDRDELVDRPGVDAGIWSDASDRAVLHGVLNGDRRLTAREMCMRHVSGRESTVVCSAEVVTVGGEPCVLLAGLDATARKEAEARHDAVLRALPDWVFVQDAPGFYVGFHGSEAGLLAPPSNFIGRHVRDVLPPDLADQCMENHEAALRSGVPQTMEYTLRIDDEDRHFEVRSVRSDRDRVLSLVRDVTARKRAEQSARELREELTHAGRVLALGALNGSLAHEVNQPLAAISTNAFVALRMLENGTLNAAELRELLTDIVIDGKRIDDVLRRMRMMLRKDRRDYSVVDINAIVSDVLKLVHSSLIERGITTDVVLAPLPTEVMGDRIQLQQVVLNLLMNAADAVAGVVPDERRVSVTTSIVDGYVHVSIADRGNGVTDADFAKMFEPFFTTKPDGMGLGLSICRAIMEAHDGEIAAQRNADRGLTCSFALSVAAREEPFAAMTAVESRVEPRRRLQGLTASLLEPGASS